MMIALLLVLWTRSGWRFRQQGQEDEQDEEGGDNNKQEKGSVREREAAEESDGEESWVGKDEREAVLVIERQILLHPDLLQTY